MSRLVIVGILGIVVGIAVEIIVVGRIEAIGTGSLPRGFREEIAAALTAFGRMVSPCVRATVFVA